MPYRSLRSFLERLDRAAKQEGPALLFENPQPAAGDKPPPYGQLPRSAAGDKPPPYGQLPRSAAGDKPQPYGQMPRPAAGSTPSSRAVLPVAMNLFGTLRRTAWALSCEDLEEPAAELRALLHMAPPVSFWGELIMLPKLGKLPRLTPQ